MLYKKLNVYVSLGNPENNSTENPYLLPTLDDDKNLVDIFLGYNLLLNLKQYPNSRSFMILKSSI